MTSATPPARYDLPWKTALTHAFREFMDFFFPNISTEIDWSKRPRFRDKELARLGFGQTSNYLVADKLIEVLLRDGSMSWVLVHVEIQAQRDPELPRRILDYNYTIFYEYKQPVSSMVVLGDDDPDWRPNSFYNELFGTKMGIEFSTTKLADYAERTEELAASDNPFALVTLAHLRTQQARHNPDQLLAAKWQLTKLLFQHGWNKERIIVLFKVINWMMALPEPQLQRYWQQVGQLEKEETMELIPLEQMWLDQGLEKGRKEGAALVLERQLTHRFGPLPKTIQKKLEKADVEQLAAWGAAVLDAQKLKQVFE
ncbi:DUF4351 domain-containing protein [Duganella guangzhouensis]|nr:DUF4351 domain-containing protein [Duganella guangzhouensis]